MITGDYRKNGLQFHLEEYNKPPHNRKNNHIHYQFNK